MEANRRRAATPGSSTPARKRRPCCRAEARPTDTQSTGAQPVAHARVYRRPRPARLPARRTRAVHRLVAVLPRLGTARALPGDLRRPAASASRPASSTRTPASSSNASSATKRSRPAASTASCPPTASATTSTLHRRAALDSRAMRSTCCGSRTEVRRQQTNVARPTSSRRRDSGLPTTSAASPSLPASAYDLGREVQARPRRLQRDHGLRRSPTGWPKPSPNACTSRPATTGATARPSISRAKT